MKANENLGMNQRRGNCLVCGGEVLRGEGQRVLIPSKGIRIVCRRHIDNYNLLGYGCEAFNEKGTSKTTPLASTTIGIELEYNNEVNNISALRTFLSNLGFIITSDCTVYSEAKSPIYEGLSSISKVLQTIEREGFLPCTTSEGVGAHMHVYCNDISYVRRYYHSIFLPLANYIRGIENKEEVFGSNYRFYAQDISRDTTPMNHSNIFNVEHSNTIEFRLPKIRGYKQYLNIIKFWREVGCYINHFDFDKNNSDNSKRLGRARTCGEALVKIAKKYF